MDSSSVLQKLKAREKVLRKARRFQRLLATDPTAEQAQRLLTVSRRFVQPLGDNLVVEGGLDSKLLEVDEATMSAGCVISAIRRDRHGDVVRPKGCLKTLADYQKNPRVFFAHKSNDMPVGSCRKPGSDQIDFTVRDDDILSRCYFHGKTQESEDVFELVCCRQIEAASIGFFPLMAEVIEGRFDPNEEVLDLDMGGLDFLEWSIIEWSWVPVPANPDALRSHLESTRGQKMSRTVRKAMEPYATPLKKRSQVSFAMTSCDPWKVKVSKAFDIASTKLPPASARYALVSKYLEVPLKEIRETGTAIPMAKIGSFLTAWADVVSDLKVKDTRNIGGDGSECPPYFEAIELNSEKKQTFLVEGSYFYEIGRDKLVASFRPTYYGLSLTLYSRQDSGIKSQERLEKAWDLAREKYNFLKGEAFSLSGQFLPKTSEAWEDLFLSPTNETTLKRTLKQLNDKQLQFANRGTLFLGPPGTGKTLSGRLIRNQTKATFVWLSARDFSMAGSFGGLSYAFELARELAPCVLFIEDVDNWLDRYTVDLLKTEMDGIGRSKGIWTILTTNFPEQLPEALIDRPGRFHDVLNFHLPEASARKAMLARWLPGLTSGDLQKGVEATDGYSGAHVYELAHFARLLHEDEEISLADALQKAIVKVSEQRQLVQEVQNPSPRPRSRKSLKSLALYRNGRVKMLPSLPELPALPAPPKLPAKTVKKGAIPYAHHECAPEGQSWDGPAEVKKATPEQLKAMCAWYDADNPESKSSYKLPHHTAEGCKTVWAGVHAAMSALLGGRGGTNIPASDRHAVYSHLAKHYKQDFGKDPPEFHNAVSPDTSKDLSSSVDPTNYSGSPDMTNLDQSTGQTNEQPQAIIFHTTRFHSVKDCQSWLLENGYDPNSEIYEGDEADEPFVAVQFPSEECLLDTARRESIEDGVDIVFCVCKEKPDVADNLHESDEQTPIDSPNSSNPPAPIQQADLAPAITKDFDDTSERYDSLEPAKKPGEEEEPKPMPYGAELCKAMHGHLCSATEYLEKAMEVLDHPKVKSHMEGLHKALMGHAAKIKAMACSLYPEHFEGDGDESGPGDDDSDYGAKSLALSSEQKGLLHQVSETLTELADEPASLKKSQKTLARLHAQQLQKLAGQVIEVSREVPQLTQKNSPAKPLEVAKDPWDTPEVQEVLAGLLERQKALFQDLYAVTGKEIPGVQ